MAWRDRPHLWILNAQNEPVPVDGIAWHLWFGDPANKSQRILLVSKLKGGCDVSTVFIGLDYNHTDEGPPLVYETAVFDGPDYKRRTATEADAAKAHWEIVERVRKELRIRLRNIKTEGRLCGLNGTG